MTKSLTLPIEGSVHLIRLLLTGLAHNLDSIYYGPFY